MHLSSLCTASIRKLGRFPNSLFPTSRLQFLTRFFCTALAPVRWNSLQVYNSSPRSLQSPSPVASQIFPSITSPFCSAVSHDPAPQAVQGGQWSPGPAAGRAALALGSSSLQLTAGTDSSSPPALQMTSRIRGRATWTITCGSVPKCWEGFSCGSIRGESFWSEEEKGVGRDQRRVSRDKEKGKRKSEFFWGSFHRNVFLRNSDLITKALYLV